MKKKRRGIHFILGLSRYNKPSQHTAHRGVPFAYIGLLAVDHVVGYSCPSVGEHI